MLNDTLFIHKNSWATLFQEASELLIGSWWKGFVYFHHLHTIQPICTNLQNFIFIAIGLKASFINIHYHPFYRSYSKLKNTLGICATLHIIYILARTNNIKFQLQASIQNHLADENSTDDEPGWSDSLVWDFMDFEGHHDNQLYIQEYMKSFQRILIQGYSKFNNPHIYMRPYSRWVVGWDGGAARSTLGSGTIE